MTNVPATNVLILDGANVVTGRGAIVPAPGGCGPSMILTRIAAKFGGDGVLFLTGKPWPREAFYGLAPNWTASGEGPWYTVRTVDDELRVRIGLLGQIRRENDPLIGDDLVTTAVRHQLWHDLTGVPFYGDGGTTSNLLLDATIGNRGRGALRRWESELAPRVTEPPWLGPWTGRITEMADASQSTITLDRNAQYLAAARELLLPLDALQPTGATPHPGGPGFVKVIVPASPEPRLPHPYGAGAVPGAEQWITTVTHARSPWAKVIDSWTCPRDRARRLLDGPGRGESGKWYERLRDTRATMLDGTDNDDTRAVLQAVKDTYSRGCDHLAKPGRRWYRRDWTALWHAKARDDMYAALLRAGRGGFWPVACSTDSVTYPGVIPPLRLGTGMGEWKVSA